MTISYTVAPFPVGSPDKRIQKGMIAGICFRTVLVRHTQHSCQHIHVPSLRESDQTIYHEKPGKESNKHVPDEHSLMIRWNQYYVQAITGNRLDEIDHNI